MWIGSSSVRSHVRSPISTCAPAPSSKVSAPAVRSVATFAPIFRTAPGPIAMRAFAKFVLAVGWSEKPGCSRREAAESMAVPRLDRAKPEDVEATRQCAVSAGAGIRTGARLAFAQPEA